MDGGSSPPCVLWSQRQTTLSAQTPLFPVCVRTQTPRSVCEEAWSRPLGGFREGRGEGPVSAGEADGEEAGWSQRIKTSLIREDKPPPKRRTKVSKVTNLKWNFWH